MKKERIPNNIKVILGSFFLGFLFAFVVVTGGIIIIIAPFVSVLTLASLVLLGGSIFFYSKKLKKHSIVADIALAVGIVYTISLVFMFFVIAMTCC